jgi:hypothetical protein
MTIRLALLALLLSASAYAEAVKDREGAVRQDKAKLQDSDRWNYNDVQRGFDEAKKSGKPVLVILRCVPCLACMGLDTGVLMENAEISPLLDQFVCVRLINANAIDLARFQFDYDLSFTTMFFNADGTVYGRYGSWKHQKNSQESATEGLKKAMVAALDLHKGYPANKAALAGKQPGEMPFKTPVEIPQLAEKYKANLDWEGKVVQSCVHCHMIGAALQTWHRQQRKPLPENLIYPFPEPETIGLTLASEAIAQVEAVAAGSIAEKAGLKVGDQITSFAGQPLIAIADVSWALHRAPNAASLECIVSRDDGSKTLTLTLPEGWRRKSDVARRVSVWPERGMALGGLRLEPHDGEGIGLKVKGMGQYGMHAAAKKAGFKEGDVIISISKIATRITEGELLGYLLEQHFPGDQVPVTVLRGGERQELSLPMQ